LSNSEFTVDSNGSYCILDDIDPVTTCCKHSDTKQVSALLA